ncbi:hypothetical protein Zmor_027121 [Zophobas morio]|jgi:hypothetical protein|uniref:Secreted protein n=1 Tax=Zophobas morio TaxID=2755281 RepID=A0AA38HKI0_9CUCU|nr:hypothetical protein Zmor_027121 [Zophobas morio]
MKSWRTNVYLLLLKTLFQDSAFTVPRQEEICAVVARSLQHSERYKQKTSCLPSLQELTVNSIVYREHVCCVSGMPNIGQQHVVFRCEGAYFFPTQ